MAVDGGDVRVTVQSLDPVETSDFSRYCVERHQKAATVVTSNRTPVAGDRAEHLARVI
jgi:hypothetical protein